MKRSIPRTLASLLLVLAFGLVGCNNDAADDSAEDAAGSEAAAAGGDASDATATAGASGMDATWASLTVAEASDARSQKICPVSEEPLGSMGEPIKVTIEGRDVYVCCEGCIEAVENEPAKYFAIVDDSIAGDGDADAG